MQIQYPPAAEVLSVITTQQMLDAARREFARCDGLISVAAPCDFQPVHVQARKIGKTGQPLQLTLVETPDIVAALAADKQTRWVVGFALETHDRYQRALAKLLEKRCDLMIINGARSIGCDDTQIEVIDARGHVILNTRGPKEAVAAQILGVIHQQLIDVASLDLPSTEGLPR